MKRIFLKPWPAVLLVALSFARSSLGLLARQQRGAVWILFFAYSMLSALAELTIQVKPPASPPEALVRRDGNWNYHKGTNSPAPDWNIAPDRALDWPTAPGGFGFAPDNPAETSNCRTILNDMFNRYSTLYIRQAFRLDNSPAADQRLLLTVDWDDGFVAYLDGIEVARFNAPGESGNEPASSAVATASHESSNGNPDNEPQPARTFDLGAANHLSPEDHVLAVIGLNRAINSTDFVLVADLNLTGTRQAVTDTANYSLLKTNVVVLSGTNTFAHSTRVTVNGNETELHLASGTFESTLSLEPGVNPLFIAALDTSGEILGITNLLIVSETASTAAGGIITTNTTWSGIVRMTNNVIVAPGITLEIAAGSVIFLTPTSTITAGANGTLIFAGSAEQPIYLLPTENGFGWTASAVGSGALMQVAHCEAIGGTMRAENGGTLRRIDAGIPSAPRNLQALVNGTNQLALTWVGPAMDGLAFTIERSESGTSWNQLARVEQGSTNFVDASAALGQRYFYRVRSENSEGVSRWSNIAAGTRSEPFIAVEGLLTRDLNWFPEMGTMLVIGDLTVPTNCTLKLIAGTNVKVTNHASLVALGGGAIEIEGEQENAVTISPALAGAIWGQLSARGDGSSLRVRFADIAGGQTTIHSNAVGLLEDSRFHHYRHPEGSLFTAPLVLSSFASQMTMRRCHLSEYHETLFRDGVITIEDCLFEYCSGDGLDFDGAQPGTALRRCTFRHGTRAPSNIDAVDIGPGELGPCRDVTVEDCLIYDFPTDKAVSIGDAPNQAIGTIVRNSLIYDCAAGIQVKDGAFAEVYNCTMVGNRWGITNYNKANPSAPAGGGHIINAHNNILWGNTVTIALANGATLSGDHNNFGDTNWDGAGNIRLDPKFVDPFQRDYRLAPSSPSRGSGRNGADMGAQFPVGSRMASSHPVFESVQPAGEEVILRFWADPERSYTIESVPALSGAAWTFVAQLPSPALPRLVEIKVPAAGSPRFYRIAGVASR